MSQREEELHYNDLKENHYLVFSFLMMRKQLIVNIYFIGLHMHISTQNFLWKINYGIGNVSGISKHIYLISLVT